MAFDWSSVLASAGLLTAGAALTEFREARRHRLARKDAQEDAERAEQSERRRDAEQGSVQAASMILPLLDGALAQFKGSYSHGAGPLDDDQLSDILSEIRRHAVYLSGHEVRERVEMAAEAFDQTNALEQWGEQGPPGAIAWRIWKAAREAVGAVIRREPVSEDDTLRRMHATIEDYWLNQNPP